MDGALVHAFALPTSMSSHMQVPLPAFRGEEDPCGSMLLCSTLSHKVPDYEVWLSDWDISMGILHQSWSSFGTVADVDYMDGVCEMFPSEQWGGMLGILRKVDYSEFSLLAHCPHGAWSLSLLCAKRRFRSA